MQSKYKNVPVVVDSIRFASQREAKRYGQLKMLQMAKEISDLSIQVPYELNPGGTFSYKYYADFEYLTKDGDKVTEDVKGMKTNVYKKKRALMLRVHGITIKEV